MNKRNIENEIKMEAIAKYEEKKEAKTVTATYLI